MFQNLSIARRTTLVLGLMMLAMLAVAGLSLAKFNLVSQQISEIADAQVERIALSQRWDANIREAVARWSSVSLAPDAALFNATKEKALAISTDTTRVQKRFAEIESSTKGVELGKELGAARALWLAERDKVRAAIEAGDQAGAVAMGKSSFAQISDSYLAVSARHADYQIERARDYAATAIAKARTQLQWLIGLTVLCLLGALGLGVAFARSLTRPLEYAVRVADRVAAGDLTESIQITGRDEAARMLTALQGMQERLRQVVGQISETSGSIGTASAEIATGNQDLSGRTEQAASNLQQAASSLEQLTGTVGQTADSALTANQLAASASTAAERGGAVVAQVVSTMEDINISSKKISDIIGTIDGIAFQTNILALNAAVEAARAGEQGRGFAVVASEVRSLAQRSAAAAREIKALIQASVEKVDNGTRLVRDAGTAMDDIVGGVRRVSDVIGEISAATSEQSAGLRQVNEAVAGLDQMTQQNAALVEEMAAAASSLKGQSQELVQAVAVFRLSAQQGAAAPSASAAPQRAAPAARPPSVTPPRATPKPKSPAQAAPKLAAPAAPPVQKAAAKTADEGEWESF